MKNWSDPEVTEQVEAFYLALSEGDRDLFAVAVERLAEVGPTLGRPTVAEIDLTHESAALRDVLPHLKELRVGSSIRVLFTFGPDRVPVLLVAGDKRGDWSRWYPRAIKEAARAYGEYLADTGLGR
jgi:hypothetical protein